MNILFLSLERYWSITEHKLYTDLLRKFIEGGHKVYSLSPVERREHKKGGVIKEGNSTIIKVNIGNIQKTNIVEKGISTLLIERQYLAAIRKHLNHVKFDLVLYPTPPITFVNVVEYIKKRDGAYAYLMLKDIFPQNAVDIGMMTKDGIKGLLYKYFRNKEKKLYAVSDKIGCMSQANVDYVLRHNAEVSPDKVEICPNCIEVQDFQLSDDEKIKMREKYSIPTDKKVFVYGGNLGRPQGIPFIIECLKLCKNDDAYFLIVGDGTEFGKLENYVKTEHPGNVKLMKRLPKDDYDRMIAACDVGLIFLDHSFTIPNFPSRLLAYMQVGLPVIAATDPNTDIGKVITEGGFGWWCESNNADEFVRIINDAMQASLGIMRIHSKKYLQKFYTSNNGYNIIYECLN